MKPTGIESKICRDLTRRQRIGIKKYGTTVMDNPLTLRQWLVHAYEECLDQAVYLRRAIEEIDTITRRAPTQTAKEQSLVRDSKAWDLT